MKIKMIKVSEDTHKSLKIMAAQNGITIGELVASLIAKGKKVA